MIASVADLHESASAPAQVSVTRYVIEGRTPDDVRRLINERRPTGASGTGHDAVTSWRFQVDWATDAQGECVPSTVTVLPVISITLPTLTQEHRRAGRLQQAWTRYLQRLEAHERRHADLVVSGTAKMQAEMRAASSCGDMIRASDRWRSNILAANREYDERTGHGRSEGAVFP